MPRLIDVDKQLAALRTASPDATHLYSARLNTATAIRLLELCLDEDLSPSGALSQAVQEFFRTVDSGLVLRLSPNLRDQLDETAAAMHLTPEALVGLVLADHLHEYMQRAVARADTRNEAALLLKRAAEGKPMHRPRPPKTPAAGD